jgi:hypothetical protein
MTGSLRGNRWLQFSLRTFLLLVLLAGVLLAWFGKRLQQAQEQQEVAKAIMTLGGHVYYDYQFDESGDLKDQAHPQVPAWLRRLIGDDFFGVITEVTLTNGGVERLAAVPSLRRLDLFYPVTDADLKSLQRIPQLRVLSICETQVTGQRLQALRDALPPDCQIRHLTKHDYPARRNLTVIDCYEAQRRIVDQSVRDFVNALEAEGYLVNDRTEGGLGSGEWTRIVRLSASREGTAPLLCYVEVVGSVSHSAAGEPTFLANRPMEISRGGKELDDRFITLLKADLSKQGWPFVEDFRCSFPYGAW